MTFLSTLFGKVLVYGAILLGVWLYGFTVGNHHQDAKIAAANLATVQNQQKASAALATKISDTQATYDAAIKTLNDANVSLIASVVRGRTSRKQLPITPAIAKECAGVTGSQLSSEDAGFLAGEASDCDHWKLEVIRLVGENDDLRAAMIAANGGNSQGP